MPSNVPEVPTVHPLYDYSKVRDRILTADLIEFASYTPLGWIIRKGTGREVNHTAFTWKLDHYAGIRDRLFLLEALGHGLEWNSLSGRISSFRGKVYWSKLNVEDCVRNFMLCEAIRKSTKIRGKKRYDYISLLRNAYRTVNINDRAWFCSEFYHYLLVAASLLPKGERARRPGEFKDDFFSNPVLIYDSSK
jgi:hypothetical protein